MIKKSLAFFLAFIIFALPVCAADISDLSPADSEYDPSSILIAVKNNDSTSNIYDAAYFNNHVTRSSSTKINSVKNLAPEDSKKNELQFLKLSIPKEEQNNIDIIIEELRKDPNIVAADKNYYYKLLGTSSIVTPNDPDYSSQYALKKINAHRAWMITKGSKNVNVGVIDSGFVTAHPDLKGNINSSLSEEFCLIGNLNDLLGHGTHVAGIIGASTNNSVGVAGVAWNANLVNLKVTNTSIIFDDILCERVISAIRHADNNGIKILNISLGG